jgi:glyoxylase-like metal-dependent hydrolase (beta-lactamase superfamily II)/rhodanese-related sulfurtransferase
VIPAATATTWSPQELKERLDSGRDPFVLDVRNRDEFEAWRIEGPRPLRAINSPYFEMLEEGGKEDLVDSIAAYLKARLEGSLPRDTPILAVCAKGGTSAFAAQALARLGYEVANLEGGMAAWADFHEVKPVVEGRTSVFQIGRPARGCLSYVVACGGEAIVIDPLRNTNFTAEFLADRQLRLVRVLDTHAHADHISGGPTLAWQAGVPYMLHPFDAIHPMDMLPAKLSFEYLHDGSEVKVGDSTLRAIHIPGHTLGNLAFILDGATLFSGDSLFVRSVSRPDLGGQPERWTALHYRSLRRLLELPDATVVLPGHFSRLSEADGAGLFRSTIAELKRENEGVKMALGPEEAFAQYVLGSLPNFPPQYVDIKRVNLGLKEVEHEAAFELEIGKNICALSGAYVE